MGRRRGDERNRTLTRIFLLSMRNSPVETREEENVSPDVRENNIYFCGTFQQCVSSTCFQETKQYSFFLGEFSPLSATPGQPPPPPPPRVSEYHKYLMGPGKEGEGEGSPQTIALEGAPSRMNILAKCFCNKVTPKINTVELQVLKKAARGRAGKATIRKAFLVLVWSLFLHTRPRRRRRLLQ